MSRRTVAAWMILGPALAGLLGCSPTAQQADPARARETLRRALDAWQNGESLEAFQGARPAVTVVEQQWRQGVHLLQYELQGEAEPNGFDLQFSVNLSLQGSPGKKFQKKAIYNVSTAPALVIVRSEGSQ
jgi:hypothetical protein